jgi:alpha-glucosidase
MGSSLGGLISYYAVLKYPEVFGKAGVFSPAFWINPEIFELG